jgi:lipooligosaccharide transport system ATP-binding protein
MEEAFQLCDRLLIMHKGRNIMEGRPHDLLEQNMEKYVLEVRDAEPGTKIHAEMIPAGVRMDDALEIVRYYCDRIDVLKEIAASALKAGNYLIRQTNLEDVFLRATGRGLNDKQ